MSENCGGARSIAFLTTVDPTGKSGQNVYSRNIAVALANRNDVDLVLICPEPKEELPQALKCKAVKKYYIRKKVPRSLLWHITSQFDIPSKIRSAIRKEDITAMVTPLKPPLFTSAVLAHYYSISQITIVEGMIARNVGKKASFPGAKNLANIISFINAVRSEHVFTAYEEAKDWISSLPLMNNNDVTVFNHGVMSDNMDSVNNLQAKRKTDINIDENKFTVGYVGSFKKYHCLDTLVDAIESIIHGAHSVQLVLVGEGPQLEKIKKKCRDKGIKNSVYFTGFVQHEKVPNYVSLCDIMYGVIDPNHWGSPMKIYEYLACGAPVIAYKSKEFEFIEKEEFGYLVDSLSHNQVSKAIFEEMNTELPARRERGKRARQHIIENRTWANLADQIINCL